MAFYLRPFLADTIDVEISTALGWKNGAPSPLDPEYRLSRVAGENVTIQSIYLPNVIQLIKFSRYQNPIVAKISDSRTWIMASFSLEVAREFEKKHFKRMTDGTSGAVVQLEKVDLIITNLGSSHEEPSISLNVQSFKIIGCEGAKMYGSPVNFIELGPTHKLLGELSSWIAGGESIPAWLQSHCSDGRPRSDSSGARTEDNVIGATPATPPGHALDFAAQALMSFTGGGDTDSLHSGKSKKRRLAPDADLDDGYSSSPHLKTSRHSNPLSADDQQRNGETHEVVLSLKHRQNEKGNVAFGTDRTSKDTFVPVHPKGRPYSPRARKRVMRSSSQFDVSNVSLGNQSIPKSQVRLLDRPETWRPAIDGFQSHTGILPLKVLEELTTNAEKSDESDGDAAQSSSELELESVASTDQERGPLPNNAEVTQSFVSPSRSVPSSEFPRSPSTPPLGKRWLPPESITSSPGSPAHSSSSISCENGRKVQQDRGAPSQTPSLAADRPSATVEADGEFNREDNFVVSGGRHIKTTDPEARAHSSEQSLGESIVDPRENLGVAGLIQGGVTSSGSSSQSSLHIKDSPTSSSHRHRAPAPEQVLTTEQGIPWPPAVLKVSSRDLDALANIKSYTTRLEKLTRKTETQEQRTTSKESFGAEQITSSTTNRRDTQPHVEPMPLVTPEDLARLEKLSDSISALEEVTNIIEARQQTLIKNIPLSSPLARFDSSAPRQKMAEDSRNFVTPVPLRDTIWSLPQFNAAHGTSISGEACPSSNGQIDSVKKLEEFILRVVQRSSPRLACEKDGMQAVADASVRPTVKVQVTQDARLMKPPQAVTSKLKRTEDPFATFDTRQKQRRIKARVHRGEPDDDSNNRHKETAEPAAVEKTSHPAPSNHAVLKQQIGWPNSPNPSQPKSSTRRRTLPWIDSETNLDLSSTPSQPAPLHLPLQQRAKAKPPIHKRW